ncbi:MAG TPA: xylosidase, partial [Prevotella sp.]|nr:xylosidase [Prevotella sp.]
MVVSKNTRILIFAILSFFTFPATAGNVIKEIEGTVTDSSGAPLEGATVMIFASPRHCNTDSRGHYHLEVADGDDHVYAYYPGMEFANIYRKAEQKELNITLIKRKALTVNNRKDALNTAWYNPTQKHTTTYCNPLNIEYNYEPYNNNVKAHGSFRSAADPMALIYKNQYLLFATNQGGYFYSDNLSDWQFRQSTFQRYPTDDDVCAPAAFVSGDTLFYTGSTYEGLPVWYSTHPETGRWARAIEKSTLPSWDPCLFLDDDGKLYLYYGSSNDYPIKAVQLSREDFAPISKIKDVVQLYPKQHGWERFGKNNDDSIIPPFVEGAYMTKHNGKYYLQYGAPGTEFKTYADGVYVGNNPLGPFTYQKANPFSYKPGGFIKGSGHGGTFQDMKGNYWHVSTCMLSQKYKFERRIALYPAGFDQDNIMYCSTAFGDYPTRNAEYSGKDRFTGWMLLSYHKPIEVSST